ncbi:hypothetical protein D3C73_1132190 [compost metagenome]
MPVTFWGEAAKRVAPGETFWSDEAVLVLPEGHYLAFTWTIRTAAPGKTFPYNVEGMLVSAYDAPGNYAGQESNAAFSVSDKLLVLPSYIGYKKKVAKSSYSWETPLHKGYGPQRMNIPTGRRGLPKGLEPGMGCGISDQDGGEPMMRPLTDLGWTRLSRGMRC